MHIVFLIEPDLRQRLFAETNYAELEALRSPEDGSPVRLSFWDKAQGEEALRELMRDAEIVITSWGSPYLDGAMLQDAPELKFLAHAAGSVKPVASPELFERGVRVSSSACVLSRGVSVTALGLTICAAKDVFRLQRQVREGGWLDDPSRVQELFGLTIGVVGFGFAGRYYAELVQQFPVRCLVYDPFMPAEVIAQTGAEKVELPELLAQSDIVSIHAPAIDATHHLINAETLAQMKDQAVLINTARGSIIDEEALADSLRAGKLKAAYLDVTDPEPPAPDSPLRSLSNCYLTPHIAGCVSNGQLGIGRHVVDEIRRYLAGEALETEVLAKELSRLA